MIKNTEETMRITPALIEQGYKARLAQVRQSQLLVRKPQFDVQVETNIAELFIRHSRRSRDA